MEDETNKEEKKWTNKKVFSKRLVILIVALLVIALGVFLLFKSMSTPTNTGTANLAWNANTETDLAGYKIYYGTLPRDSNCPPGGYTEKVDVGNVVSYIISGLNPGATYYFSISSYDTSDNESCFSPEVSKTIIKENIFKKVENKIKNLF